MPDYFEWSDAAVEKPDTGRAAIILDSDLYRELWADARKVVDDAPSANSGLQSI